MANTNYSLRIDETDKREAERVFKALGMTFAAGINAYIKKVGQEKRIPFALEANRQANPAAATNTPSEEKKRAYEALKGILSGHEVDLDEMRSERVLSR